MKTSMRLCSIWSLSLLACFSQATAQFKADYKKTAKQEKPSFEVPEYGAISLEELKSTHHHLDSSAAAAYLFDIGECYFTHDLNIILKARVRIKIYDKSALDMANISIRCKFNSPSVKEKVNKIRGATYNLNEDGSISRRLLVEGDMFSEKYNKHTAVKRVTMPDVKVGSIIEYEYEKFIPSASWLPNWYFQSSLPVNWSEYKLRMPPFYEYHMSTGGFLKFDIQENYKSDYPKEFLGRNYDEMVYRLALKDIPAFKNEPYITTRRDYLAQMKFQLAKVTYPSGYSKNYMNSWENLSKQLLIDDNFSAGKKVGSNEAARIAETANSIYEKAKAIYEYVQKRFRWNEVYNYYPSKKPKELWEKKVGFSCEINLLYCNMLNSIGILAKPVLLSTRAHGLIDRNFPLLSGFNHVVVFMETEEGQMLADASHPYIPFGLLPPACLNGVGLILDKKFPQWARLERGQYGVSNLNIGLKYVEADEKFDIQIKEVHKGYAALGRRSRYADDEEELKSAYDLEEAQNLEFENPDDNDKPFTLKYNLSKDVEVSGDRIYMGLPRVPKSLQENPFKSEDRKFPINYGYPSQLNYRINIQVPQGYEIESLPSSLSTAINGDAVKFTFKVNNTNGLFIQILSVFQIKKDLIEADKYQELKTLYTQAISKFSEQFVFKKKAATE